MKKIILIVSFVTLLCFDANADFLRVEMGGGVWNQSPSGTAYYNDGIKYGTYTSSKKDYTGGYAWLLVKHPLPVVPNFRFEYSKIKDEGIVDGVGFKDFVLPSATRAKYEMNQYDIIPYYNILDNTAWITVDFGLDIKVLDTTFKADLVQLPFTHTLSSYTDSETFVVPLVYLRSRVQIPSTGFGIEADGKYVTYNGSTLYDVRVKVDYTFDISPLIQPGIEIGYRAQKFDIKTDGDKTKVNLDFAGVYAGIMLRF